MTAALPNTLNHYDLATLSLKVYDDPVDIHIPVPTGWNGTLSSSDDGVLSGYVYGYFGRLYTKGDTAIIAQRGTAGIIDIINDIGLVFEQLTAQFSPANEFYDYVKNYTCTNHPEVKYLAFTGHSLGAALAELSAVKHKYAAVTFDSPGTKEILINKAEDFPLDAIAYGDNNVVTYNAAPNIVNTMAEHVGTIHRVYPSVDSMVPTLATQGKIYYSLTYSINGQHKIGGIVDQFNIASGQPKVVGEQTPWPSGSIVGYNGFDHYESFNTNPYYWNWNLKSLLKSDDYLSSWLGKLSILINEQTLSIPTNGVNITADNSGNKIWGTTNFDDLISAGSGNDIHYMHKGDGTSTDTGGNDTYIVPIGLKGKKTIDDTGGIGLIKVDSSYLAEDIYPVIKSACPIVINGTSYFKDIGKYGSYYLIENGGDLLITPDCADNTQSLANSLTIKHFSWGNLGLTKYTGGDKAVLVGSNGDDYLDCSIYKQIFSQCFVSSLKGEDILVAEVGQNAVLTGSDVGKKVFKILKEGSSVHNMDYGTGHFHTQSTTQKVLNIEGVKEGDILDLSDIISNSTGLVMEQNGTNLRIDLGGGNIITSEIALGDSYVSYNLTNGNLTVSNQNMTKVLEDAGISIVNGSLVNNTSEAPNPPPTPTDPTELSVTSQLWFQIVAPIAITVIGGLILYKLKSCCKKVPDENTRKNVCELPTKPPIGIALEEGREIELVKFEHSKTYFDYENNDTPKKTSWVGSKDAILVYDHNNNKMVDHASKIVLTSWCPVAKTDFAALLCAFDSNNDKRFDENDAEFSKFAIWQDKNQNGVSEHGELIALRDAGFAYIDFNTQVVVIDEIMREEYGMLNTAEVNWEDGRVTMAYDLVFSHA